MTAQSPDLNCALYLWRLQVYNDYNVTSMEALLTLLKDTKNPSHKYVPPSLLSEENSSASVTDVKFADMYPPYEDLGVLQGLVAMAIVATDIALLLWIVGSLVFFWRSAVDVICNPLDGRHIVCKFFHVLSCPLIHLFSQKGFSILYYFTVDRKAASSLHEVGCLQQVWLYDGRLWSPNFRLAEQITSVHKVISGFIQIWF